MPKAIEPLSAVEVKRIHKPGRYAAGGVSGLHLVVAKRGSRQWVLRARIGTKRRDIGLGGYPSVTLAQARNKAREYRERIAEGVDVIAERKAARQALIAAQAKNMTFAEATRRKHEAIQGEFKTAKHSRLWLSQLQIHAFPVLEHMDVAEIELAHVLQVLEPIWYTKTATGKKVRQRMEAVLSWATVSGHRDGLNPARWKGNLSEVLPSPSKIHKTQGYPALPWQQIPDFMAELRQRTGTATRALEMAMLCASRSGEVRGMTWQELDLQAGTWTIPPERMKRDKQHTVPLSPRAIEIIKAQPRMQGSKHVFTASRGGQVSDMSLAAVIKRMHDADTKAGGNGYMDTKQGKVATVHGMRSAFKDWCRNRTSYADEVSELCLAHVNSDSTRAAYARDGLLPQRARLLEQWATFCASPAAQRATVSNIGEARA